MVLRESRIYQLYDVNLQNDSMNLMMESADMFIFAKNPGKDILLDRVAVQESGNANYLFNSWYYFYHYQYGEPFAFGNDFCGRLSWNQSYRMAGILELYRKTNDSELKEALQIAVSQILEATNERIGVLENEYNPRFLWSSRIYSLNNQFVAFMVDNGRILGALLSVANTGILEKKIVEEIITISQKAYDYYETYYDGNGHYRFQNKAPVNFDGIVLPWNQQNAMASAWLELWMATGEEKYLRRVEEMLDAFRSEWEVEEGIIRWYYWPKEFYKGWEKDSCISKNTPSRKTVALEEVPFEDISHAAINAGFLAKYFHLCPAGIITEKEILSIQNNMNSFCFEHGFSRDIGGLEKESYLYPPGDGWGYYRNQNLERYVRYLPVKIWPDWDSQAYFSLAAQYYCPVTNVDERLLEIQRFVYQQGKWQKLTGYSLQFEEIKEFVKENYGMKTIQ